MSKSGKSSAIVVFDDSQNNGDMITLGKRGKKYMNQVKEYGNRWWDTMNHSSNEKFYEQFESKIK